MSARSSAALLLLSVALALPGAARAEDAVIACGKAALKQLIIVDKVRTVQAAKDRRGIPYGTEVLFTGKLLGKRGDYRCLQTTATGAVTIEPYNADAGLPHATVKAAEAACTRQAQAQNLSVGRVVKTSAQSGGREALVEMSVFEKGAARTAACTYDIATGRTSIKLSKPAKG